MLSYCCRCYSAHFGRERWRKTVGSRLAASPRDACGLVGVRFDNRPGREARLDAARRRFAQDGRLTVADHQMVIVSPETGEKRTATFRIDPTKSPRQIDLFTRDDRIFRGIFKFEEEDLVVCLQPGDSTERPRDFEAPEGSERILIRLKTVSQRSTADRSGGSKSTSTKDSPVASGRDLGLTESALRRAHELLAGSWDIVSMVDDGSKLGPELIRAKFAENGRVRIGTRAVAFVSPQSGERRISAIKSIHRRRRSRSTSPRTSTRY